MKNKFKVIRQVIPQWFINYFKHLPEAVLANLMYAFPSRKIRIIGVTGTDGKTTTVNMIYRVLQTAGKKVSMVSTINASVGGKEIDTGFHVTSPNAFVVQKLLRRAVDRKDEYMVLEVTSHALDQFRFWGVNFEAAVVTNITHEHLDYHKNWKNYFFAKAKLIKSVKLAVLNKDEKHFNDLIKQTSGKVVSFGFSRSADFNPKNFPFKLIIPGDFNILNGLAAAAICKNLGIGDEVIKMALQNFKPLRGRMQEVENKLGLKIIIDFAHTPNGLRQALSALRVNKKGRLIAIIGAEGDRDVQKRPIMGEVAKQLADLVIITAVDPRGQIEKINNQIMEGVNKAGGKLDKDTFIISDRQEAIDFTVNKLAKRGDIIGIFGKGHEKSMNITGTKELPWSDFDAVEKSIS